MTNVENLGVALSFNAKCENIVQTSLCSLGLVNNFAIAGSSPVLTTFSRQQISYGAVA